MTCHFDDRARHGSHKSAVSIKSPLRKVKVYSPRAGVDRAHSLHQREAGRVTRILARARIAPYVSFRLVF